MEDIVFVKGNIIVVSGNHKVKEMVAYASDDWEKIADVVKPADHTISDKEILMPYNIFCASGDIVVYGDYISGLQYPKEVERIFFEEIDNLQRLKIQKIDDSLVDVMNRQIYIGVVGTMELFLCDFLLSVVLGLKRYFNTYYENSSSSFKAKEGRIQDRISEKIVKTNYHIIKDVEKVYREILQIEFPSTEKLESLIKTRHDLVHRNGYTNGTSEYKKVTPEMIDDLIAEVNSLVGFIIESGKSEIENWIPDPSKSA